MLKKVGKKKRPIDNIQRLRAEREALEAEKKRKEIEEERKREEHQKHREQYHDKCFSAGQRWAEKASWKALDGFHGNKHNYSYSFPKILHVLNKKYGYGDGRDNFYDGAMTVWETVMKSK